MILQLLRYLGFSAILVLIIATVPVVYADWRDEMYCSEELDYNYKINNGEVKKICFIEGFYEIVFYLQNIDSNAKLIVDIPYDHLPIINRENSQDYTVFPEINGSYSLLEYLQYDTITIVINGNYSGYSLKNLPNQNLYHQTFEFELPIHSEILYILTSWPASR